MLNNKNYIGENIEIHNGNINQIQKKHSLSELIIVSTLTVLIYIIPWIFTIFTEEYYEISKNFVLLLGISLLIMIWGVMTIIKKKLILYKTPVDLAIILLLLSVILSTIFSINVDTSVWGYHMRLSDGLISYILLFTIFYLTINTIKDKKTILFLLKNVVFAVSSLALFTVLKSFNVFQNIFSQISKQNTNLDFLNSGLFSPTGNTNVISYLFVLILPLALFIFINKKSAKNIDVLIGIITTIILLSAISITSLANTPTLARISTWVIVIILLIFNIFYTRKLNKGSNGKLLINIILLLLALFSLATTSDNNIYNKLAEKINFSHYYDIPADTSWNVISSTYNKYSIKSFVIGTGPETYAYLFPQFRPVSQNQQINWFENYTRSNTQIEAILVNEGILGLLAYLVFGFLLILFLIKKVFTRVNWDNNRTLIGLGIFVILYIISFLITYQTITLLFISWLCLALIFKLSILLSLDKSENKIEADFKIITNIETKKTSNIAPYLFTVIIILISTVIIFTSTINYLAEVYYKKALILSTDNNYDEAYDNLVYAVKINNQRDYYHKEIASIALSKLITVVNSSKKDETTLTDDQKNQLATTQQYLLSLINSEINKAIVLNPENYENWQRAALIYKKLTELSGGKQFGGDTLKAIQEAIILNPTNPDNYLLLGYLYQYNSDESMKAYAENAYLKAYNLQPGYALSIIQLGSYLETEGKYSDALKLYTVSKENIFTTASEINKYLSDKIIEMKGKVADKITPTPEVSKFVTPTPTPTQTK